MSKNIAPAGKKVSGFSEVLQTVTVPVTKKGGSARIQSGLQAMFDRAKEEGFAEGRAEGYQDGLIAGRNQGRLEFESKHGQEIQDFRMALEGIVLRCENALHGCFEQVDDKLTTVAIDVARRAINQELSLSRSSVVDICRAAMGEVRRGHVTLRVNPFDVDVLQARMHEIKAGLSGSGQIEVVSDPAVLSGCVIEHSAGVIDAQVDTYLERLQKEAA